MDKLGNTIKKIKTVDSSLIEKTQHHLDNLTKPRGSLGLLETLAKQIVAITGNDKPLIKNKTIFIMAGDHGVTEEGVSAFPKEVTVQMVYNFLNKGAAINVLAGHAGAEVVVVDMGISTEVRSQKSEVRNFKDKKINFGTKNMVKGPAMTRDEAIRSVEAGIEVFEEQLINGLDLAGCGEMGIGNTTSSSAITAVMTGKSVKDITGRGTGIDNKSFLHKVEIIEKAIFLNNPDPRDALDVLSKVGGFEIGGLTGIILAAARENIPVLIDGFISGAAALIAYKLQPIVKDYMIAAHCSAEKGHKIILDYLGLKPILDLNLCLGEGTGAVLAMGIVEAGVKILTQMATFKNASVSGRN